jgi:hypothetical protein
MVPMITHLLKLSHTGLESLPQLFGKCPDCFQSAMELKIFVQGNTVSSITCEAAFRAFDSKSSSNSEIHQKRAELMDTVQRLSLHPASNPLSGIPRSNFGLIVTLIVCSSLLILP